VTGEMSEKGATGEMGELEAGRRVRVSGEGLGGFEF